MTEAVRTGSEPTDEDIAAALAAVWLARRHRRGRRSESGSRWPRAGRMEAIAPPPRPATWSTAERPR